MTETTTCPDCAAPMVPGATWCLSCQVRRPAAAPVPDTRVGSQETPHVPEYSRTKAGASSFGVTGRIIITVATLLMLAFLLEFNTLGGILWSLSR